MDLDAEIEEIVRSRSAAWPDIAPILRADGPFTYFIPAVRLGAPGLFIRVGEPDEDSAHEMARLAARGYAIAIVVDGKELRTVIDAYMMLEEPAARQ